MINSWKKLALSMILLGAAPAYPSHAEPPVQTARYNDSSVRGLAAPAKSDFQLLVDEQYDYYDIEGTTLEDLRRNMRNSGTKWGDGKTYAALCTWDIRYRYDVENRDGLHSIKAAKTDVAIKYRFPRWTNAGTAPEDVAVSWNRYHEKLHEHEYGHRDLAVKCAGEINDALASLGNFKNQRELDREARKAVQAVLKKLKDVQVAYDDHTQHGVSQGAILN